MITIFEIKYVSKGGTVVIGGGSHPLANAISIDGLGIPEQQYNTVDFTDVAGQSTTNRKDIARIITITGDLIGGQTEIEQFYKAIYYEGELYLTFDEQCRKIRCKVSSAGDMSRNADCDINGFSVQFVADYPYFTDFEDTETYIIHKENKFPNVYENGEWFVQLPAIATETTIETNLHLNGDIDVYPIIKIYNEGSSDIAPERQGLYIELGDKEQNKVASIEILVNTENNELITVDLPKRQIVSNIKGDITHYITDDTILSDFKLKCGDNYIWAVNYNTNEKISAWLEYSPEYLTAVY